MSDSDSAGGKTHIRANKALKNKITNDKVAKEKQNIEMVFTEKKSLNLPIDNRTSNMLTVPLENPLNRSITKSSFEQSMCFDD